MKYCKPFWIPLATVLCLMTTHFSVHAELTADVLKQFRKDFNGNKFYVESKISRADNNLRTMLFISDSGKVDVSAYHSRLGGVYYINNNFQNPSNNNCFVTFMYPPAGMVTTFNGPAVLMYNETKATTFYYNSSNREQSLWLGVACLYAQFALGNFGTSSTSNPSFKADEFRDAIEYLYYNDRYDIDTWTGNQYLKYLVAKAREVQNNPLLSVDACAAYWLREYNLLTQYDFSIMGNLSVFLVQIAEMDGGTVIDYSYALYAVRLVPDESDDPPPQPGVPEPATVLLWTLGCLGLGGMSRLRRRNKKNPALA
jgi:hypothetical protein